MRLKALINEKFLEKAKLKQILSNLKTGVTVEFFPVTLLTGAKAVGARTVAGRIYVVEASVRNFIHFKHWIGERTLIDIIPSGKRIQVREFPQSVEMIKVRLEMLFSKGKAAYLTKRRYAPERNRSENTEY